MSKNTIYPQRVITIDLDNLFDIPILVTDNSASILHATSVSKSTRHYITRHQIITILKELVDKYEVDTILFEQNKLFIDKIDKYPDPYVMKNILLGFGVKTSIEDNFYDKLTILELPEYEWKNCVLNRKVKYAIDLYKSHIKYRTNIPIKYLTAIDENNYYKAVCLSESVLFDKLMDKKYQINKGE